jgi:hypothetical protein
MTWKKTLIRNLLFAVLVMAAGFYCTGCFTATTLDQLGSTRSHIAGEHYEFSPERGEIILSCRKDKEYYYIPLLHPFGVAPRSTVQTYEKHIPLNPVPENMMRFELEVIPDASAARAEKPEYAGAGGGFGDIEEIMRFPAAAERLRTDADPSAEQPILSAGDMLRLRVHPDDLPILNGPFMTFLLAPFDRVMKEYYPEYRTADDRAAEAGHDSHDRDIPVNILVFPYARNGTRCTVLTGGDLGFRNLHPFSRELEAEVKQDNEQPVGALGWCWKIFWVPTALVKDVALIPVYPFYMLYRICSGESVL